MMRKGIQFKAEKGRVLVPVGEPCAFGCKYCYTRSGEVGPARVRPAEILRELQEFTATTSFDTIQFGYDGDPFVRPERGVDMLRELAKMGKDISFSTKALVDKPPLLDALKEIRDTLAASRNTLVALVSLTCWESADFVEPHTPTAPERITTVKNFKALGIPTFIAVRPILPNVPDSEYERIAIEGIEAKCDGFILGPLYSDRKGQFVRFISPDDLKKVRGVEMVVSWSAHEPTWIRYEDSNRLKRLEEMYENHAGKGKVFLSSADAVAEAAGRVYA